MAFSGMAVLQVTASEISGLAQPTNRRTGLGLINSTDPFAHRPWPKTLLTLPLLLLVTLTEALNFLQSLQLFGFQPGLETTRRLAAAVGHPEKNLRFIHVAGTNGKGSTCAFLEQIYRGAGYRTGLYTSPHLVHFGERIQIDRQHLPDDVLARLVTTLCDSMPEDLSPTFFEFTTVMALLWFAQERVDLVIWETGLGGRLDATNIVNPLASLITNIGLDHKNVLGTTLGQIAFEKAGIIKPSIPVLTSATAPDALAIIEYRAHELDSHCVVIGHSALQQLTFPVSLSGPHQRVNATLAAATCRLLRAILPITDDQIASGLANTTWAGRMQRIDRGGQILLLDGAHNPDGIAAFKAALISEFPSQHPTLIVGMLRDKAWQEMILALAPLAARFIVAPVSSDRTVTPEELREVLREAGSNRAVRVCHSVSAALRAAASDPFVALTGSLYFIGEALQCLQTEPQSRSDDRALNNWVGDGAPPFGPAN